MRVTSPKGKFQYGRNFDLFTTLSLAPRIVPGT